MFVIAIIFLFAASAGKLEAAKVSCEKFDSILFYKKLCFFNGTTVIGFVNTTVADLENSDVDGIVFESNKKINFLPVNVYKKFPNLVTYGARNASIKEISTMNFDRLTRLAYLDLRANEIKFVPNSCFEGLFELKELFLGTKATNYLDLSSFYFQFFPQETTEFRQLTVTPSRACRFLFS